MILRVPFQHPESLKQVNEILDKHKVPARVYQDQPGWTVLYCGRMVGRWFSSRQTFTIARDADRERAFVRHGEVAA